MTSVYFKLLRHVKGHSVHVWFFLHFRTSANMFIVTFGCGSQNELSPLYRKRLRWSRSSVLAFGTQVRKPGWSRRIFQGEKILGTPSFGREVKPFFSCRRFAACKRSLKKVWKSLLSAKFVGHFSPSSSTSRYWNLWRLTWETPGGGGWKV